MRILGSCPDCEALDAIQETELEVVRCGRCQKTWKSWDILVTEAARNGLRLIPVCISASRHGVNLSLPSKYEIPWANTIVSVLNATLLARYPRLQPCFATEGGVQGRVGHGYVELRNNDREIGLWLESPEIHRDDPLQPSDWALKFYERLLRQTFEQAIVFKGRILRPGAILWVQPEGSDGEIEAWRILSLVLQGVGGRNLPAAVLEVLRKVNRNIFAKPYLRGLTDEEIVQFFVPPPGFEKFTGGRES